MKIALTLLALLLAPAAIHAQETTVILVRHAEKTAEPANDPLLSPAGIARAEALLESVRGAGITHVITTTLQRTVLTAAPTATALGIASAPIDPRSANHPGDVAAAVRERAGGVVLVVGHSNTIPAIVRALGGTAPDICDAEYDNLYVMTLRGDGGAPRVIRSRYGVATPVDGACNPMVPVGK